MQVKIVNVDVEWVPGKTGKYGKATVSFERDGKEQKQYLVSFKNPDVFKKVQEMVGQTVEVETVKNGDFWEWKSITVASGATSAPAAGAASTRVTGSNYETKEERAARQVMIAKQSSLDRAVEILKHNNPKGLVEAAAVKELAQDLTDWVLGKDSDKSGFDNMSDDIPF
jgi:hypothetical protein